MGQSQGLPDQPLELSFGGGLNQKIAEKLLPPGQFLTLENMTQDETGKLSKRNGYTALGNTDTTGEADNLDVITSGKELHTFNNQLLLADGDYLYSYNEEEDNWLVKGTYVPMTATEETMIANGHWTMKWYSMVECNGYRVYTYRGIGYNAYAEQQWYSIQEIDSGMFLVKNGTVGAGFASNQTVRMLAIGTTVFILYANSGTAKYISAYTIDLTDPYTAPTSINIITDGETTTANRYFAVCNDASNSAQAVIAYRDDSSKAKIATFNSSGTVVDSYEFSGLSIDPMACCVSYSEGGGTYYCLLGRTSATPTEVSFGATDFGDTNVENDAFSTGTNNCVAAAMEFDPLQESNIICFWEEYSGSATTPDDELVRFATLSATAGTVSTAAADFFRSVGLASGAARMGNHVYVCLNHESNPSYTDQSTFFLARATNYYNRWAEDPQIVARLLVTRSRDVNDVVFNDLPPLYNISDEYLTTISQKAGELLTSSPSSPDNAALDLAVLKFDFSTPRNSSVQIGNELLLAAGMMYSYDGVTISEKDFHLYPQTVALTAAGSGSMSDGTYQVVVVYKRYDGNGKTYVSAVSESQSITLSGGTSVQAITVAPGTARLSNRFTSSSAAGQMLVECYRTLANGSIYYYAGAVINNSSQDATSIVLTHADSTIDDNKLLYTTGGVLDHIAPPAIQKVVSYQNRAFALANDGTIYYTKEFTEGQGVQFNDAYRIYIDPRGGKVRDIEVMDQAIVIAKEKKLMRLYGNPANSKGEEGSIVVEDIVSADFGMKENARLGVCNLGILVPSDKGLWLLSRDYQTMQIGDPVADYDDELVIDIDTLQDQNQIRFLLDSNEDLMNFNLDHKTWEIFTNHTGISSCIWDKKYCFLTSAGQVYKQDTSFTDGSTAITADIETSWLNLAGLAGYQRVKWVYILGNYKSSHTLNIKITTKHDDGDENTETITKAITSDPGEELIRFRPQYGKCRSMKIEIYDSNQAGTGESYELWGLRIVYAVLPKLTLSSSKTVGS